jgi:hypothetical protein
MRGRSRAAKAGQEISGAATRYSRCELIPDIKPRWIWRA